MDGLNRLRKAARMARKKVDDAEKKYGKDWQILLDAREKEQKEPASQEAQAAYRRAIDLLNKHRRANNALIEEWLKSSAAACEAERSLHLLVHGREASRSKE